MLLRRCKKDGKTYVGSNISVICDLFTMTGINKKFRFIEKANYIGGFLCCKNKTQK